MAIAFPQHDTTSEFADIVLLVVLSVWHGRTERYGAFWMVMYRFPATFVHELNHLIMGLITFSKPTGFSLWPRRTGEGWILGSVNCSRIGMFSALPVGLAPALICLPSAWYAFTLHSFAGNVVVFVCLTAATPSEADIRIAFSSWIGVMFWMTVAGGILFFTTRWSSAI